MIAMRILVIGSGAREHALLYAMSKDPQATDLHVAPGNAGMSEIATMHPLVVDDPAGAVALAKEIGADLVVIGPEVPLVAGVADALRDAVQGFRKGRHEGGWSKDRLGRGHSAGGFR